MTGTTNRIPSSHLDVLVNRTYLSALLLDLYRNRTKRQIYFDTVMDEDRLSIMQEEIKDVPEYLMSLPEERQDSIIKGIVKTTELILRNIHIDPKNQFLDALKDNPKGYIPFSSLFSSQDFKQILETFDLRPLLEHEYPNMSYILNIAIRKISRVLWSNRTSVRLLSLPIEKISPVFFELVPQPEREQFQSILSSHGSIQRIDYNQSDSLATVYTNQPDKLQLSDGSTWVSSQAQEWRVRVIDAEQLQRSNQSFLQVSSLLKDKQKHQSTILHFMPSVWSQQHKIVKSSTFSIYRTALVAELVDFSQKDRKYQSCSLQEDGTFRVEFPRQGRDEHNLYGSMSEEEDSPE